MAICNVINRIEVPIFLLLFALVFADSVTTNWLMYRTCYILLEYNETECALLGSKDSNNATEELIEKVQPHVTVILMAKTLIEAVGSTTICFFIGPWSDQYGRRPVLLLSFVGYFLAYLSLAIESAIFMLSPWYSLIFVVPICFSGGLMAIISVCLSYITDITSAENRGIRMAIFHAVAAAGFLSASLSSSFALASLGYFLMYVTATCCILLAWFFICFILAETVSDPKTIKIRGLFRFSLIKTTAKVTFMKRGNCGRSLLLTIVLLVILYLLAKPKDSSIYLFTQNKFHWSLEKFTIYNSVNLLIEIIGSTFGLYCLRKLLGIKEFIVLTLGFVSVFCGAILLGLADTDWVVYVAALAKCLDGVIRPVAESLISRIVPPEDTGKIFSFMAMCQNIISPLGSPMFTFIYNNTLSTFPEAFNFVTAGLYLVGILLCIVVIMLFRKQSNTTLQLNSEEGKFL